MKSRKLYHGEQGNECGSRYRYGKRGSFYVEYKTFYLDDSDNVWNKENVGVHVYLNFNSLRVLRALVHPYLQKFGDMQVILTQRKQSLIYI